MASSTEVSQDIVPFIRIYKDGTIERYAETGVAPAGLDSQTRVLSKDISIISPSARIYRPDDGSITKGQKLPVLIYFHGGAFCIASPAEPMYHHVMNQLVSQAKAIVVSVDYRSAPENPLPAAYDDSWAFLQWVLGGGRGEPWLEEYADFERLFLAGDSAGANITHHLSLRVKKSDSGANTKIKGITLIHPYFWGKDPIGKEVDDIVRKAMVDKWWMFVCPSDKGCDDPYINPFVDEAPSLKGVGSENVIIFVAENDILCDRGKLYYENLVKSEWQGKAEIVETKAEDHVFHIFNPDCDNAHALINKWASFINQA
ncbi:probable carboxylesterase 2 [Mercurialis annua]|uniref:probable carboxylesterase 2 n=1 Tax=Mercurialis annua TaxID=3986 RepID=UPI00215F9CF8|nr:probable carboxylesterase 2 [Mercurialis annua]